MTVENSIRLLNHFKDNGMTLAYDNMKNHILSSKKFRGHPILEELNPKPKAVIKPKEKK